MNIDACARRAAESCYKNEVNLFASSVKRIKIIVADDPPLYVMLGTSVYVANLKGEKIINAFPTLI